MTFFASPLKRIVLVFCSLVALAAGTASAQTLGEINKASGFYEQLKTVGPAFTEAVTSTPGQLPKNFQEAVSIAAEGGFDEDKMETAIESRMADKLTTADLAEIGAFYASALGKHIAALEVQSARPEVDLESASEGKRILAELPIKDPARVELYRKIVDDLRAVDLGEAIALNVGYATIAGMQGAAGNALSDQQMQQIMDSLRQQSRHLRPQIEKMLMEDSAYTYRNLSLGDLKLYSTFLASSAGNRYFDQLLTAFGVVVSDETRSFGHRLSVALGYRKA